uniref:Vacuolar protein sorting-associated protein 52 homolog n=1 Tax=Syphacia muris TaxID=451379 RepID=A0A0N5AMR6_9BILA
MDLQIAKKTVVIPVDDEVIRAALESGMDLNDYSGLIENQLKDARDLIIRDCIEQADKLADLHTGICACDEAFARLEDMLKSFQSELGTISADMKRLQQQSVSISQELQNRQKVRGELSQFVDDMVVPHTMIQAIMESDVSERLFVEQLHELQHKLQFLKAQEFKDAKAVSDVQDVIENLKYKAMAKIREWLILKINSFKKPLTNYLVSQGALLKNRFFYEFLLANDRQVAREIRDEYVDTLSKMYYTYFKTYASRLFKLQLADAATKDDLLGAEDAVKNSGFFSQKVQVRSRATVFSLGSRNNLLSEELTAPLIVPHAASQANERFQFEILFRSLQYAFVDHLSHEYLFICDFFMVTDQTALELFSQVMTRSLNSLLKISEEYISTNYDAISLFLCICLCVKYLDLMNERGIPSLDGYWETLTRVLWRRFDTIMKMHNDSVKAVDIKKLIPVPDTRPHHIVRRYAEFTCALLVCGQLAGKSVNERLQKYICLQQVELEHLLNKFAGLFSSDVDRLVCIINNYDMIISIFEERVTGDSKEKSAFWELQQTKISEYVEAMLKPHFGEMISFVTECEPLIEQGHTQLLIRYIDKLTVIVRSFNANWKRSIANINRDVVRSFTNFKNGSNILQATFTQLIQYYHRFNKVLTHEVFADSSVLKELVNIHHIMVEIKKYKPVY